MKILIFGNDDRSALENIYRNHLQSHGKQVKVFPMRQMFISSYNGSVANKLRYKLNPGRIYNRISNAAINEFNTFQPDVVWVFKGMELFPRTIEFFKSRCLTVYYNADHPLGETSKSSYNSNVRDSLRSYHHHFTYSKRILSQMNELGMSNCSWLPFGYEPSVDNEELHIPNDEMLKVCFVGNADRDRAKQVKEIGKLGLGVDVYGDYWERHLSPSEWLNIFKRVDGRDYWETLTRYRVQLNLLRPQNAGSHNMRTFEIPYARSIMLAPNTAEHLEFFDSETEVSLFTDTTDLVEKAKQLLSLSTTEANEIRQAARSRSERSRYSYERRAKTVLNKLKELLHER